MEKRPQDQTEEQLNNDLTAEDFSLEDILNEFGGWSRKGPPDLPEEEKAKIWTVEEKKEPSPADEAENREKDQSEQKVLQFPQPPSLSDTIRFTPIKEEKPEKEQEIWSYHGEPVPENDEISKEAKRELLRQKKREKHIARMQKRQKQRQTIRKQMQDRPERVFDTAADAYSAYNRKNTLRLRQLLSTVLCVLTLAITVFCNLNILDLSGLRTVITLVMLGIMLLQMLLAYDVCVDGILRALRLRFDHTSLLVLLIVLTTFDSFFAIAQKRLPLCPVVSMQLALALWGRRLLLKGKCATAKTACGIKERIGLVCEEKAWHGKDCIFRSNADEKAFVTALEMPDASRRIMRFFAPAAAVVSLILAVLCAWRTEENLIRCWTAMLVAVYPAGALICYARPFAIVAKHLMHEGSAVAGWHGAKNLGGECGIVLYDADLFPQSNVSLNGMKIYSDRNVSQIAGYAAAVVSTAGSGLKPLFDEILLNQNGRKYSVDTFRRYEGGGLGAEIQGDVVLMGSLAFMKLMRVQMEEGSKVRQAVYLSINGELAAVFALKYTPAPKVKNALNTVVRTKGLTPILATRDFMITPQLLSQQYKLPPDRVEFPTVAERAKLSSGEAIREPKQGAWLSRDSFTAFCSAVSAARAMRSAANGSLAISMIAGMIGILIVFFLCFIGSPETASCWNMSLFTALWMLPQLLLTALAGRNA